MESIPLVRMRYADSLAQVLDVLGAPVESLLNHVSLSREMLASRDDFISTSQLWRLYALAADYTGEFDIGLKAGLTPLEEHSQVGQNLVYAPTLYQAFEMMVQMATAELTNAEFNFKREGNCAWFCGGPVYGSPDEQLQVGLYRIALFIQLVRWVAGPDWRPWQVRLQVASIDGCESDLIRGACLEFNCREPAIAVPPELLSRELLIEPPQSAYVPGNPENMSLDFRSNLKSLLRTQVRGRRLRINEIANALDLSVRTLQRRLAEHGLVFSELVEQTRVDLARELLRDPDIRIRDIASETGYAESSNFARAFRRVTGISPHEYRAFHSGSIRRP